MSVVRGLSDKDFLIAMILNCDFLKRLFCLGNGYELGLICEQFYCSLSPIVAVPMQSFVTFF